jgi:hypothetical protein
MTVDTIARERLIDEGAWVLATNQATMAVSRSLMTQTRDLLLTHFADRLRVIRGGADDSDGDSTAVPRRGREGGYARAARLTAERRSEIARVAAQARWERFRNGIGTGPPDPRLGGLARAQTLTPEERQQIARKALAARLSARSREQPPEPPDGRPLPAA